MHTRSREHARALSLGKQKRASKPARVCVRVCEQLRASDGTEKNFYERIQKRKWRRLEMHFQRIICI